VHQANGGAARERLAGIHQGLVAAALPSAPSRWAQPASPKVIHINEPLRAQVMKLSVGQLADVLIR
jgi:hypothetical protein